MNEIRIDSLHFYRQDGDTIEFCTVPDPHTCKVTEVPPLRALRIGSQLIQMAERALANGPKEKVFYLQWAKTEEDAMRFAAEGWEFAGAADGSNHNNYSVLYRSPPGWTPTI